MIDMNKEYQTRGGKEVKIYEVDGTGKYPVYGAILREKGWDLIAWTVAGEYHKGSIMSDDLVEKPKIIKGWINVYKCGPNSCDRTASTIWETKEVADAAGWEDRIACIEVEFKEGEGL